MILTTYMTLPVQVLGVGGGGGAGGNERLGIAPRREEDRIWEKGDIHRVVKSKKKNKRFGQIEQYFWQKIQAYKQGTITQNKGSGKWKVQTVHPPLPSTHLNPRLY